jgi:ribosomal protein L11 methyltransferase
MRWIEFAVKLAPELLDSVTEFFVSQGANGVVIEDQDPGSVTVKAYFSEPDCPTVASRLNKYLSGLTEIFPNHPKPLLSMSEIPDENWAIAWKDNFKTIEVGRSFIVTPPWLQSPQQHRHVIIIDPAEAFGTGTHETTQSCMILLEDAVEKLHGEKTPWTVMDVGCGSGILAFAALMLGAQSVLAVDDDPKAIESAIHNARLNNIFIGLEFRCSSLADLTQPADVVTANLDTATITLHKEALTGLTRRFLIVSGIPIDLWEDTKKTLQSQGLHVIREINTGEWGSALYRVRDFS